MEMKELIGFGVGLVLIVLLVGSVVMPSIVAPTIVPASTVAYSDSNWTIPVNNLNTSFIPRFNFTNVVRRDTSYAEILEINYTANTTPADNASSLTVRAFYANGSNASLGNVGVSPVFLVVNSVNVSDINLYSVRNGNNSQNVNITGIALRYEQLGQSQQQIEGWNAGLIALWTLVGLAIVAIAIIMVIP